MDGSIAAGGDGSTLDVRAARCILNQSHGGKMRNLRWLFILTGLFGGSAQSQTEAKLIGDVRSYFGHENYPRAAIRAGAQGRVVARLDIDQNGLIRACTIDETSGNADLDATTCQIAHSRLQFTPARDRTGKAVAGYHRLSVSWALPDMNRYPAEDFRTHNRLVTEVHVGPDGRITSCRVLEKIDMPEYASAPCERDKPGEDRQRIAKDGKAIGYTIVKTLDWAIKFDD